MSDPMFDYILARSRARETSILAVTTIASSASLVLFGLYMQIMTCKCWSGYETMQWVIVMFGVVFAIAGILYRDSTALTIHRNDDRWLQEYAKRFRGIRPSLDDEKCDIKDPAEYRTRFHVVRIIAIRLLLIIPIIAWSFVTQNFWVELTVVTGGSFYVGFMSYLEHLD